MRSALRAFAAVSFVSLLVAATSAYSPSRLVLAAIADAGADAGTLVTNVFGPRPYLAASKSFGGAPLDPQGFGGLGLRGGGVGWDAGVPPIGLARVGLAAPTVVGDLDPEIIQRIVRRYSGQIRFCYESLPQPAPNAKATVDLVIGPSGDVTSARGGDDLASCIAAKLKAAKFPQPKDGRAVKVTYPFELH